VEAEPEEFDQILEAVLPILAEKLMGPLARSLSALGARRARLVTTGTLGLLPLHAVVQPDLTLSYVPSARALRAASMDKDHAITPPAFLGVGDPARGPEEQLDFARLEVEQIAGLFQRQGRRGDLLPPERATRGDIAKLLAGTTHLHFACHGSFEVDRPLQSALYLAGDERLTLESLLEGALDVSALRLVVLSACQTGLIDFLNVPDEVVGFPAGFLQAGVPAVISTLWPVDDASTAILLARFYQGHLDGMEPGLALHAAQDWLRTATAVEMDLAGAYEAAYQASGRHRLEALDAAAYYRANPAVTPFSLQSHWAAFYLSGV
jgi:CHAT domain-containing protein